MGSAPFESRASGPDRSAAVPPAHRSEPEPLRVLVVRDDDAVRSELEQAVRLLGHTCRSASDGLEAWALYNAEHADIILSEWQLPGMDGIELCRRTRTSAADEHYSYFVFLTGFADRDRIRQAIDVGADDYHVLPVDPDELRLRLTSAGRVIDVHRRLADKNTALRRDSQSSFLAARIDPLTRVANRLRMNEDLHVLWSRSRRYGHAYCAALCDIDWFKAYNDHFGHLEGDGVLLRVAQTIRSGLRQGDGLYRYGGEEFLVLLPEQSLDEACIAVERVRKYVERLAIPTVSASGVVTISAGVSELSTEDDSLDEWLRRVDTALYLAKAKGRNRIEGERRTAAKSAAPTAPSPGEAPGS